MHRAILNARWIQAGLIASALCIPAVRAAPTDTRPPELVVVGITPLSGLDVDLDKLPSSIQSLTADDLKRDGSANLLGALQSRLGSVSFTDTLADPVQPDVMYRGFQASPVLGSSQGLAVYQDGVRINEAFGDTVNWDLFPDIAIDRLDIVSASPLFGLNALGGAVSIAMKNGFTHRGADAELSGGSFDQHQVAAEFGVNDGRFGLYGALHVLNQHGWRRFAHDAIRQFYLAASYREGITALDLSFTRAHNLLDGPGAAPVQSLALNRSNVFTGPQGNADSLDFVRLKGSLNLAEKTSLDAVIYARLFRQDISNGDNSDYTACVGGLAELCQSDGATPLMDLAGKPIPDITQGGSVRIGQNDFEHIHSNGYGTAVQFSMTRALLGHGNSFAVGASFDAAHTAFDSGTQVGILNPELQVLSSNLFVDTAEGTADPATPVRLNADNSYFGFYATDSFDLLEKLTLTASARYNMAKLDLIDRRGRALNGSNRYSHFNPAMGLAYKLTPSLTAYLGFSINNRAPTASEIECSDPLRPCLLPSSLAADPPTLRQVVAHTLETGLRGRFERASLNWNIDLFRTDAADDIYAVATSLSSGVFQNIGATRRQGVEMGVSHESERWSVYLQYSYLDATFRSALTLPSPANPHADAAGDIRVLPKDRLPLMPSNRLKLGADFKILPHWSIGASWQVIAASFYRGDESNQNPQLAGYHLLSLRSVLKLGRHVELFASVQNLLDARYSTLGLFGDPSGVGAPGVPDAAPDNRFLTPGMPRAYFGGFRASF